MTYNIDIRGKSKEFTSLISARKYAAGYFTDHPRTTITIPIWGSDETVAVAKTYDAKPKKVLICAISKKSGVKVYKLNKDGTLGSEVKERMKFIW